MKYLSHWTKDLIKAHLSLNMYKDGNIFVFIMWMIIISC